MPPDGPELCDADGVAGGRESNVDTGTRIIRARAEGAAFQTHISHGTVEFSFQAVGSYPAVITLGITFSGGAARTTTFGNSIRGEIEATAELRDVDAGTLLEIQTLLDESHNDLGFEVIASGLFAPSASFSRTLEPGTTYLVRLRVQASGTGPGGNSDFLSGLRGVRYGCLSVAADLEDTDGDGIYDVWEAGGVDLDGDGVPETPRTNWAQTSTARRSCSIPIARTSWSSSTGSSAPRRARTAPPADGQPTTRAPACWRRPATPSTPRR